ncbi:hypothetical protein LEP1GSC037_3876 [Leptospira interrogans str. 2006001854]|uniref:Uncharacterized protein n=1 Tax=Leptospira interrogans str. 2006001854 TaxID=1001590 RepID=M6GTJ7_LEPIR|nr:hypothetical protein LEP1GSC037_3876 [Leptospira interrogans str. 2006001854]
MNEITSFIKILAAKLGAYGAFNIPEYFHDAVLFHKSFQFVDPEKEGRFRAILQSFNRTNLRELSDQIHKEKFMRFPREIFTFGNMEKWFPVSILIWTQLFLTKNMIKK